MRPRLAPLLAMHAHAHAHACNACLNHASCMQLPRAPLQSYLHECMLLSRSQYSLAACSATAVDGVQFTVVALMKSSLRSDAACCAHGVLALGTPPPPPPSE